MHFTFTCILSTPTNTQIYSVNYYPHISQIQMLGNLTKRRQMGFQTYSWLALFTPQDGRKADTSEVPFFTDACFTKNKSLPVHIHNMWCFTHESFTYKCVYILYIYIHIYIVKLKLFKCCCFFFNWNNKLKQIKKYINK